jgi:putative ABC transport system permease protein
MHQFLEAFSIALQAIWANKLRSLLTVLGNIVAVTSIIAVVSLVQGLNNSVQAAFESEVSADNFQVQRTPMVFTEEAFQRAQSFPRVTLEDAEAIRAYAPNVAFVMAQSGAAAQVKYRQESMDSVSIRGVTREYIQLPTTNIAMGRPISSSEFQSGRAVAILGFDTADRLFGSLEPLDKTVTIAGVHFRVVGVAAQQGAIFGQSQDEYAVIPLQTFYRLFGTRRSLELIVRPRAPSVVDAAMEETKVALRIERRLRPSDPDNFGVVSTAALLEIYNQITAGAFAVLMGVVSLSLVVGGIVIMNIMLMVVSERTREIGLRKSLGARRRDVLWQILTESITLSTLGGVAGTVLGFIVAIAISTWTPFDASVEVWSVALGIGMTAAVGLFFGIYPAMRAAALSPIEALRRE